jgi:hypothetical protein
VKTGLHAALTIIAIATSVPQPALAGTDDPLAPWVDAIAAAQDSHVTETLPRIDGIDRRALALRSYLRSAGHLAERWSWTTAQIEAYQLSPEYRAQQAELERVRQAFADANPGFELWVNPQVRSLDIQIEHWNENESVAAASANLSAALREYVATPAFRALPHDAALAAAERFLKAHTPTPTPNIAAPGMSPHGQMRAVDFQVQAGGRIVAGTKVASIASEWDEAGWTARLEAAVRAGGQRFLGPLASPREPWHYTYVPEAVSVR